MGKSVVHHGDCLEVIAGLPSNSIDAIVTDPPYGLGFMGKEWDALPPGKEWADECLRVLKPGGHLVAFGGSRTYHRLAVAIEDAGFEIRDQLMWLYGSGFPKSLDVSKAIDKASKCPDCDGDGYYDKPGSDSGLVDYEERSAVCQSCEGSGRATRKSLGVYDPRNAKTTSSMFGATDPAHENYDGSTYGIGERHITAPVTPEAQKWNGWGTALKPAHEPIVLARKPLTGTVAANVQEYGTGALNVDGCRVGLVEGVDDSQLRTMNRSEKPNNGWGMNTTGADEPQVVKPEGRWPANLILDPEAGAMLDEQSGERKGSPETWSRGKADQFSGIYTEARGQEQMEGYGDTGGASRFFPRFASGLGDMFCVLCDLPCVTTAGNPSHPSEPVNGSAPDNAQDGQPHESAGSQNPKPSSATNAASSSPTTPATDSHAEHSAQSDAPTIRAERIALAAKSAANLCDLCTTDIAQSVARLLRGQTPASSRGPVSTLALRKQTLSQSLALIVEGEQSTGITPTTAILSALCGSAAAVTTANTTASDTVKASARSRCLYQSKASSAERNAGLDGGRSSHPTVKPIDLMRWLVRLVTPPGGTVLDPFTGSGTTGIAAALEGFTFIGIEREAEYLKIAEARIEWWSRHEGDTADILARAGLAEKEAKKHEESGQLGLGLE